MEEQFILRVPPSVAERIELLFNENSASTSEDKASSLDISFSEDGRTGTFAIGDERFPASLLDLPAIVESYKTYDDANLVKTADIGQIIMVREEGDHSPDGVEYRHGLTPPMRDARRRRFRREPDLNPELVQRVEKDLLNIMAGGTVGNIDVEQEDGGDGNARGADHGKVAAPPPGTAAAAAAATAVKPPEKEEAQKRKVNDREPTRSDDSEEDDDETDDSD